MLSAMSVRGVVKDSETGDELIGASANANSENVSSGSKSVSFDSFFGVGQVL
jgi:hypothetical protein